MKATIASIVAGTSLLLFRSAFGSFVPPTRHFAGRSSLPPPPPPFGDNALRRHHREKSRARRVRRYSSSADATSDIPLGLVESIMEDEVKNAERSPASPEPDRLPAFLQNNDNQALSALQRAVEIGTVLGGQVMAPIVRSLAVDQNWPTEENGGWEAFWSTCTSNADGGASISHAQRLATALEELGPTYVKFGQALGSRPDVVPTSLAEALSALQDDMTPFDSDMAKEIILTELTGSDNDIPAKDLEALLSSLTTLPVAAASIGQVYKAHLPGKGDVAVKVQRPGVRSLVERDTELLLTVAKFVESLPALPSQGGGDDANKPTRLINTELVSATQEFMSRIFEELDYRNEASNCITFANLYSEHNGTSEDVSVVVPRVYLPWCTENVLTMEWIDGTKLTDVDGTGTNNGGGSATPEEDVVKENLALIKAAIDSTLSQLLVTGVLHADPHAGNLLKIDRDDGAGVTLGYLDFGLLSTIPMQVRDALICSVALQVFERDVDAVSALFGELRLIPQRVLDDEGERAALAEALEITFENSLLYPDAATASGEGDATAIPDLKFDKLLDSLSRLVPRFQFDLPPYFINNARALSTLEGIAKSLDPSFNVLTIMYPYALNRLLQNPSRSPVVERTLQKLIRSVDGRIDREKIRRLLRDSALISGVSKRRVVWDVVKTKPGRKLSRSILGEELRTYMTGNRRRKASPAGGQRRKKKKWYYLEL